MRLLFLLGSLPTLLAAMVSPVRQPGQVAPMASATPVVSAFRRAAPIRQARAVPAPSRRIPDYTAFAGVALDHGALWEVAYRFGEAAPYAAWHRVTGHLVAVSDPDLLGHCLTVYERPCPVRAYANRGRVRAYTSKA